MSEPPLRRADAARNAHRIVAAAGRLLADDPQAGMADIAEAAGVTRVTVNRHFRTRENLVAAVYEHALERATQVLRACRLDEGTASEALARLLEGWLRAGREMVSVQVIEQGHAGLAPDARAHYYERVLGPPLIALMERGRVAGEFADLPAEWMARQFGATVKAALEAVEDGALTFDAAHEYALRSLLRGLRG